MSLIHSLPLTNRLIRCGKTTLFYSACIGILVFAALLFNTATKTVKQSEITNQILEGTYSLIVVCNCRGNIVYVNNKIEPYTGYTESEFRSGGVTLIIPPEQEKAHAVSFSAEMSNPHYGETVLKRRIQICNKSGTRSPAAMTIRIVKGDDGPMAYAFILPDSVMDEARTFPELK